MNYIGSKRSLIDFLNESMREAFEELEVNKEKGEIIFADAFAGTGIVGYNFKKRGYSVYSNDIQHYSYTLNKHLIGSGDNLDINKIKKILKELNNLEGIEGFITNNYSKNGEDNREFNRMYFSGENAKKIDAINDKIHKMLELSQITENEFYYLKTSLLKASDKVANTASVYGSYLKKLKTSANKKLILLEQEHMVSNSKFRVDNLDIRYWIKEVEGDILYLDPPYNNRQYASNYHILETISLNDEPLIRGKTGLRDYQEKKSLWCSKKTALEELEFIIENSKFKYIFLSYNDEGIINQNDIETLFKKHGKYKLHKKKYKKFKSHAGVKREYVYEHLHELKKEVSYEKR